MSQTTLAPPRRVRDLISDIKRDPVMGEGITVLGERAAEFSDPMVHKMVGIAAHDPARRHFDNCLDDWWASTKIVNTDEVVIGGGFHAAVYCSVRVAQGYPKPLVLEGSPRAGGAFAVSRGAAFYLNSRNRPGDLAIPGMEGALNAIPAGVVQPSDLSGDEYQRNNDLAFSIRCALAMSATVATGATVTRIERSVDDINYQFRVVIDGGRQVFCNRVIRAVGIGTRDQKFPGASASYDRVLSFTDFMSRMDEDFPLRGMRRVAVIGTGDSARTVVEALGGQGPTSRMSVASLDFPDKIDWYGMSSIATNRAAWESCNRSRYRGIGRMFPRDGGSYGRIVAKPKAGGIVGGYECAYVDEVPYDYVVACTGFAELPRQPITGFDSSVSLTTCFASDRIVAKQAYYEDDDGEEFSIEVYDVGPGARLDLSPTEAAAIGGSSTVPENTTALFRYSSRTAALASSLPEPPKPPKRAGRIIAKATPPREKVFTDKNGTDVYKGDFVTVDGESKAWPVLGMTTSGNGFVGLDRPAGGYYLADGTGVTVFGVNPKTVTLTRRADAGGPFIEVLGKDVDGTPILDGSFVNYEGNYADSYYGFAMQKDGSYITVDIRVSRGKDFRKGTKSPRNLKVSPLSVDAMGMKLFVGDRVTFGNGGDVGTLVGITDQFADQKFDFKETKKDSRVVFLAVLCDDESANNDTYKWRGKPCRVAFGRDVIKM